VKRPPVLLAILIAAVGTAAATAGNAPELPKSNINTPAGRFTALHAGATYQASTFPLPLRITVPDRTWGGAQWTTSSHGISAFGWAALAHPPLGDPHGDVIVETGIGATPSVTATIARLRTGGSHEPESHVGGTRFGEPSSTRLAGHTGLEFDGEVWGIFGHTFVPFSATTHGASPPDSFHLEKGEVFRLVALRAGGKTVVVLFENWKLPADQFPAFLTSADRMLATLELGG
jgi:hypothetical protein